jgi:hypothetical protein
VGEGGMVQREGEREQGGEGSGEEIEVLIDKFSLLIKTAIYYLFL